MLQQCVGHMLRMYLYKVLYGLVRHGTQSGLSELYIKNIVWLIKTELLLTYIAIGNILQYKCTCNIESTVC